MADTRASQLKDLESKFQNLKFKEQVLDYASKVADLTDSELNESLASCENTCELFNALKACIKIEVQYRNVKESLVEINEKREQEELKGEETKLVEEHGVPGILVETERVCHMP